MDAIWSDTIVEDANLTVAISHLRKALGQNGGASEFIETIPGLVIVLSLRRARWWKNKRR